MSETITLRSLHSQFSALCASSCFQLTCPEVGTLLSDNPDPEDVATAQRGTVDAELLKGLSALHGTRGQCEAGPGQGMGPKGLDDDISLRYVSLFRDRCAHWAAHLRL